MQYLSAMVRIAIPLARTLAAVALGAALAACAGVRTASVAGERVTLVVAATTDVHGRIVGWDYYAGTADSTRGLARAATIVDSVRTAHPGRVVLVDAGDLLQGNPFAFLAARVDTARPNPIVAAMNVLRYDAAAIGNHEFNYGLATLGRAIEEADFPFLAANAYHANGTRAYPAYTIVRRGDIRVGIVGATNPGAMIWDRENLRGRIVIRDIVPELRRAVDEVRAKGADVVVVTMHSGLAEPASYDTVTTAVPSENVAARVAREVPGVDLIVFGHSHQEHPDTVIGTTRLLQPKNWATSVGLAHLTLERSNGRWHVTETRGETVNAAGHVEHPAVVQAVATAHESTVAYVNRSVGTTPVVWRADSARVRDTPIVDFMLEVQRRAAGADLAATAAFSLDASLDAGPITVAEIARLYPYDNTLRAVRITGRQVRDFLEYSARYFRTFAGDTGRSIPLVDPSIPGYAYDIIAGADYVLDVSRPRGSRVASLAVNGKPVVDTDTFTLALNNYRQTGGGGYAMLHDAPVVYDRQQEIRQLLIDEVTRRGTIAPADYFRQNWRLEPEGAVAPAYAAMRRNTTERAGGPVRATPGAVPRPAPTPLPVPAGRTLRVIATNDFHGAFEPRADSAGVRRGGAAYVASVIARARDECAARGNCESILLDGGDMFQGSAASNRTYGAAVVELYNTLGYAAAALGNHEWDWGRDSLRARMRDARFPILGVNVQFADGRDVPWVPDDTLLSVGRLKVGVIGVTTVETPRTTMASNVADLRFPDPAPLVSERARHLRARGADAVVVVAHAGAFCRRNAGGESGCSGEIIRLAQALTERVDAIVAGHTHAMVDTHVNGIPIVQSWSHGRAVGVIDVPLTGGNSPVHLRFVRADSVASHPAADSLVQRVLSAVEREMARPIAQIAEPLRKSGREHALGQLIADAQRAAGNADFAVMNNGGIRADLAAGQATYGSFFEIHPFGNTLHRLAVRGRDLRAYLERLVGRETLNAHISGATVVYAPARPAGSRLVSVRMADGRALRDDAMYTMVLSNFLLSGGDGLGLGADAVKNEPIPGTDLDALIAYVRAQRQPLRVPFEPRLVAALP
ncbi:MAG TPA: 5'-nucleotidase C-terminal domain-containing protein [Gemmatimonadaceae bacterium]|nr:5'-nucleotidase C-terminal domain-containing protein [Gemmatimonadaceae bacterium]